MSDLSHAEGRAPTRARSGASASDLYRAVWRWHFYAGLLVLPFLIILSVTGGIYLFRHQLDPLIHHNLMRVEAQGTPPRPPSAQVEAALAARPGTVFRYVPPSSGTAAAEVGVRTPGGERIVVYVNPYDATVLGELPDRGTAMWLVRQIHSLVIAGPVANGLIEIAGGWTILLIGTGLYLWWPRGSSRTRERGGVVSLRGTPRRRVFWRDLHAVTGLIVGSVLLFLAVTGMPWSVFWGSYVNKWANGHNFGYPAGVRVNLPMSDEHLGHAAPTTWSLEQARVPHSTGHGPQPIGLDAAVETFNRLGLAPGYAVALPSGPTGVYTASVYPNDLSKQRVVHLDQYSGRPLLDMTYADYGPLGRALEWGINVHMGQQWGLANQLVLLAACIATVLLCVSAAVMWWKRRPSGSLGVPPLPSDRRVLRGVVAILAIGGVIFPLVGLSLLVMLAADLALIRFGRRRRATAHA
ncbi:MAG: PepSY domain-containing protein [Acetobacteraceae bacterium]|nr:PepSY domain-containing protein [Acetobacteraceae bacterium]